MKMFEEYNIDEEIINNLEILFSFEFIKIDIFFYYNDKVLLSYHKEKDNNMFRINLSNNNFDNVDMNFIELLISKKFGNFGEYDIEKNNVETDKKSFMNY